MFKFFANFTPRTEEEKKVKKYYKLIISMISGVREEDREDAFQAGLLGLLNGIRTYDPTKCAVENKWIYSNIKGYLLNHFYNDNPVKMSATVTRSFPHLRVLDKIFKQHGFSEMEINEIASKEELPEDLTEKEIDEVSYAIKEIKTYRCKDSLTPEYLNHLRLSSNYVFGVINYDADYLAEMEDIEDRLINKIDLEDALECLTETQKETFTLFLEGRNNQEIGDMRGVTRSAVRQTLKRVAEKMSEIFNVERSGAS